MVLIEVAMKEHQLLVAVSRIIASQLYGVSATDPRNAALAVAGLLACVALAGFIPARRAARIDPVSALRNE